ncbi:predicted protein [Ostreococcus lucimarinus CCE9901]|jgi:hypothetical protein|uniref:Uncharacterized protein n=1 Tax=Ostreococcus lucimarinus (strain CCE9901) TaxID=436017 RepID=A4S120_OSTLU|nr:predicted protein [Ostreococcus lucimarinus CCE9901]ABO97578.1 predicted protein [Ostreococcus lucimarinus CCE9901]|tara:strand:+ start:19410 stop:19850 length:441 start_codon:yes stop_codon:yes gene_type:complete|eukprot:XP_001419285.1 predicted protein [Ostreococcus lucimarinus CCE9901]
MARVARAHENALRFDRTRASPAPPRARASRRARRVPARATHAGDNAGDLHERALCIKQRALNLARNRVRGGDYVNDDVTQMRGRKFEAEARVRRLKSDLNARLLLERFSEAREISREIERAEDEIDRIQLAIAAEQERAIERFEDA